MKVEHTSSREADDKRRTKGHEADESRSSTVMGMQKKQTQEGNEEEADPRRDPRRECRRSRPEKGMKKKQTREGNAAEVAGPVKGIRKKRP